MNSRQVNRKTESDLRKLHSIFHTQALPSLLQWCRPVRCQILSLCFLGILSSLLTLAVPLTTRNLVDSAVGRAMTPLWQYGLLLAVLTGLERGILFVSARLQAVTSAELQLRLQQMIMEELLSREYAAVKPYHSGNLVNRVFSDVNVVRKGVTEVLPSLLRIIVSFFGAVLILVTMDWRFLPVMLTCSVIWLGVSFLFRRSMKERHRQMQEAEDALHASTQETLENIRIVKASGSEDRILSRVRHNAEGFRERQIRNEVLTLTLRNGMGGMFDLSWLLAYLWGCLKIYRGEFTYGSLAALIPLVGRIQGPVANATGLLGQVYGVIASAERLRDLLDLPEDKDYGSPESFDRITLDHVSFRYEDGISEVLTDLSATIRKGDFIALTGLSGGGKTSLFQLLLGIYRPTSGSVRFHEGEKSFPASKGTRRLFAYVPQGNTLFSGTLRDNLTQFTDTASEEEIMAAVHAACLQQLTEEIGLGAVIGERGIGLSEGQAQRVAIARALLSKAPILLLDEATSALDEQTEAALLQNIARLRDHRFGVETVLIVTHRPAALRICDRQWQIENGTLIHIKQ